MPLAKRSLGRLVAGLVLVWLGLAVGNAQSPVQAQAPAPGVPIFADFPAVPASLGAIADHGVAGCSATPGPFRDVQFTVSGLAGSVTDVKVTFSGVHSFVGDLGVTLIAPAAVSHSIFSRTGSISATGCGDGSDVAGPYTFTDGATMPPSGGWWEAATAAGSAVAVASGTYRTVAPGGAGAVNPSPPTNMNPAFAGVSNPNGTWTLRFADHGNGDTGSVTAATLSIATTTPHPAAYDLEPDGKTDVVVGRCFAVPCAGTSPITHFFQQSSNGNLVVTQWGIASDAYPWADYDGDRRVDLTVWRTGTFHTLQSATQAYVATAFGTPGDIPYAIGDFDGDGRADYGVFRPGSGTWFILASTAGFMASPWGQSGDRITPGDFDGDNITDFAIKRSGIFHVLGSMAGYMVMPWGVQSDGVPPGDYDGDNKTDFTAIRNEGSQKVWYIRRSTDGGLFAVPWGLNTDGHAMGDYDADGKWDIAVFRSSTGAFYIRRSSDGMLAVIPWGGLGNNDVPMGNFLVR